MNTPKYGPINIFPEISERHERSDRPYCYDEDGGPVYYDYHFFSLTASNRAYEYTITAPTKEELEPILVSALANPESIADDVWSRRTFYGSEAWGNDEERELAELDGDYSFSACRFV